VQGKGSAFYSIIDKYQETIGVPNNLNSSWNKNLHFRKVERRKAWFSHYFAQKPNKEGGET